MIWRVVYEKRLYLLWNLGVVLKIFVGILGKDQNGVLANWESNLLPCPLGDLLLLSLLERKLGLEDHYHGVPNHVL